MWLCLRKRFPPLWLHKEILNSSCVLILLIHTKHKYKNIKSWTDPTSSFPWRRTYPLGRKGKKCVTNSRAAAHKSWMVKCSPSRSGILAEAINTKILTKNYPDFPHSYPDSVYSHRDSPHSPHSQHSHPISSQSHPDPLHSHPDSPHSHHHSRHSHPDFPHSHPDSLHPHLDFPHPHPDSPRSHHSRHSVPRFPIPAFIDSLLFNVVF